VPYGLGEQHPTPKPPDIYKDSGLRRNSLARTKQKTIATAESRKLGLLLKARREYGLQFQETYMAGDSASDALAADALGCPFVRLAGAGVSGNETWMRGAAVIVPSLEEAVDFVLSSRVRRLQLGENALHLEFCVREIVAALEILALVAFLPCFQVDVQLAIPLTRSDGVNADLKNLSGQRLSELEAFHVRENLAKATLHDFLHPPLLSLRNNHCAPRSRLKGGSVEHRPSLQPLNRSVGGNYLAFRGDDVFDIQPQALSYTSPVGGIGQIEVFDLNFLNALRHRFHTGRDVANQVLSGVGGHQAKQVAGL
jgi:hypothetical protein